MILPPSEAINAINQLLHISCGARPLDKYLSALAVECLRGFDARAVVMFGLEEDLTIKLLGTFGLGARERELLGTLHFLRVSHFSQCLSAMTVEQVPSHELEFSVAGSHHVSLLPISLRGAPYAGAAIWTAEDPAVLQQEHFWEVVGLAIGLALSCQWIPQSEKLSTGNFQPDDLTPRQIDILTLVAQGATNRDIARRLNYGLSTIGHELMTIFRVLRVNSREAAGREAGRCGLLANSPLNMQVENRLVS
jgi:DNA-binding CsgD family transcriptional regulator